MAYALAVAGTVAGDVESKVIVTTTILIVAFTTLMLGGLAYPFLKWLKPPIMRSTAQTKTVCYGFIYRFCSKFHSLYYTVK